MQHSCLAERAASFGYVCGYIASPKLISRLLQSLVICMCYEYPSPLHYASRLGTTLLEWQARPSRYSFFSASLYHHVSTDPCPPTHLRSIHSQSAFSLCSGPFQMHLAALSLLSNNVKTSPSHPTTEQPSWFLYCAPTCACLTCQALSLIPAALRLV